MCAFKRVVNKIHTPPSQPNLHTPTHTKSFVLSTLWLCSDGDVIVQGAHRRSGEEKIFNDVTVILTMADVVVQEDDEIFVYTGGDQVVPKNVRRVRIDKSVKCIAMEAFCNCKHLIHVEFHDGIEIIRVWAFNNCISLKSVKLLNVKEIELGAFDNCICLVDAEFGDELETIGHHVFYDCTSLRSVTMPSVRNVGSLAFCSCKQLTDLDLALNCIIGDDVFFNCPKLTKINLVGGIHKTVASLHLERWRNEMKEGINRINEVLSAGDRGKTTEIQTWMRLVTRRLNRFKDEHKALLKEATTLLELSLWKTSLDDKNGGVLEEEGVRTTRGKRKRARKDKSVTSGASIVIKNVLPFLQLE